MMMKRQKLLTFFINCLLCVSRPLCAETITYDFSSPANWVTTLNGEVSPQTGSDNPIRSIYYKRSNDCFVGKGNTIYFSPEGGLLLGLSNSNTSNSLKLPVNSDWEISKIILHSHKNGSESTEVNIYNGHDGYSISTAIKWATRGADYEYVIPSNYKKSPLYIKAIKQNARIAGITIEYTSTSTSFVAAPTFNPGSQNFSTESLDVTISATEGCEVYYTTDGTDPSYINVEEAIGTKGTNVTIYSADSPVTLKAIAVNHTTGICSNISSATYTYLDPSLPEEDTTPTITNDGTKSKPYTVAEVKALEGYPKNVWVKGTIYGTWNGDKDEVTTSGFTHANNIVIGDATAYIPIKLTESSIHYLIDLKGHPYLLGKEILIYGDIDTYYSARSVINPSKYEITYNLAINGYGYASLYLDMPVTLPTGSTAYYCTTLDTIADLHDVGSIIPDSTGVIISSTPNTTCTLTYTTNTNSDEEDINALNQLFGFTKDSIVAADGNSYYALSAKNEIVGFYIPHTATGDASSGFTAKANKAYLKVSDGSKISMFALPLKNEETQIVATKHITDDTIYDLQGRSVPYPTPGIYIQRGKKVIIRK